MLETDIKKLTTAVQELTAAIQGGAAISPATSANVAAAVDNLAVTQQAQMDAIPGMTQQVPVQQVPVQQVPVQQVPVQQVPVQQAPVQQAPVQQAQPGALTQEIVVKHLTDAMARLGAEGQAKVIGALSANFGTHKVPEIQPAQWPQVIAVVQQLV